MPEQWLFYLLLLAGIVICLFLTLIQLPGLWLALLLSVAYWFFNDGAGFGLTTLLVLLALTLAGDLCETLTVALGAKQAGATKAGMALSIVGAITGGILLSFILMPVIGTLIGVLLGAFLGGYAGDILRGRKKEQAVRSGIGAAIGRMAGTIIKVGFGIIMLVVIMILAFPERSPTQPMTNDTPAILEDQTTQPLELDDSVP